MTRPEGFEFSPGREPHRERTQAILREHPQVRELIGKNPYSFLLIVAVVALQIGLAAALGNRPWWLILLAAYGVGAFADHALFVMIHECAHNLIFRSRLANLLSGMLANLPMVLPSSVSFQRYHLRHHAYQGVYEMDADLPSRWEARLVGRSPLAKAIWLAAFPFLMVTRAVRLKEVRIVDRWLILNLVLVAALDVVVLWLWGPRALVYLFASFVFSVGLHPLGARWIQEHYLVHSPQETYSYYGSLNTLAFNVGYHNEHHDFPSVPWNRLPRLKRLAAAWYDSLVYHSSWTRLFFRFLFDGRLLLFSRMTRTQRAGVPMPENDYRPDLEAGPVDAMRPDLEVGPVDAMRPAHVRPQPVSARVDQYCAATGQKRSPAATSAARASANERAKQPVEECNWLRDRMDAIPK